MKRHGCKIAPRCAIASTYLVKPLQRFLHPLIALQPKSESIPTILTEQLWTRLDERKKVILVREILEKRWRLQLGTLDRATRAITGYTCPLGCLEDDCNDCDDFKTWMLTRFTSDSEEIGHEIQIKEHHGAFASILAPLFWKSQCIGALCVHSYQTNVLYDKEDADIPSPRELLFVRELVEETIIEVLLTLQDDGSEVESDKNEATTSYPGLIGQSPLMIALHKLLDKVCASESTVLITGENGTGKELVAKAIFQGSNRRDKPFVVQNCSAFNDNLLDSELFGHKRGAYTGAHTDKKGLFEVADGGTFFLDEIGEMTSSLQVKMLRVLQEGTFIPVGGTDTVKVDVRIIAATNRDLEEMVLDGRFRKDLYYRINVIQLPLPPLRNRREDIELLVAHFLNKHGSREKRLSHECLAYFRGYSWPGNVRELENEIERLLVLAADAPIIGEEILSERILAASPDKLGAEENRQSLPEAVQLLERRMIREALLDHKGNKSRAAIQLKVSRRNLIRLAQKYELG